MYREYSSLAGIHSLSRAISWRMPSIKISSVTAGISIRSADIKPPHVIIWPEYDRIPVFKFVCFDAFKNGLAIVQGHQRWFECNRLIGSDADFLPFTVGIICFQHMVSKVFAKRQIVKIHFGQPASFNPGYRDLHRLHHKMLFLMIQRNKTFPERTKPLP